MSFNFLTNILHILLPLLCFSRPFETAPLTLTLNGRPPSVIGHRGSSGSFPESTRLSYEHAIAVGADYLECDIQATQDRVLVCFHDPSLAFRNTDIENADKRSTFPTSARHSETVEEVVQPRGASYADEGWFIPDFTWEKLKNVHVVQRFLERDDQYNGLFPLITLDELIDIAVHHGTGIYLESKHSTWYRYKKGLNVSEMLIENLCRKKFCEISQNPFTTLATPSIRHVRPPPNGKLPVPVVLQSFLYDDLVYWDSIGVTDFMSTTALTLDPKGEWIETSSEDGFGIMQYEVERDPSSDQSSQSGSGPVVLEYRPARLDQLARLQVTALGPEKSLIVNRPEYIQQAHAAGFEVHAWTFRNENAATELKNNKGGNFTKSDVKRFIDPRFDGNFLNELAYFGRLGLDGFFCDYPSAVRQFVDTRFATSSVVDSKESGIVVSS